jgi:hypothetical protein
MRRHISNSLKMRKRRARWKRKNPSFAFRANRRRVRGKKGRQLNWWRSERCEPTFAHVFETGGGRRTWLRGQTHVSKAHTLKCAAYNLGVLLRKVWGMRKPRNSDEGVLGRPFGRLGVADAGSGYSLQDDNPARQLALGYYRAGVDMKGILITTADYGPDAYEFAKGKPIVLMNGANLLYLLEKHGRKANIDISEAKKLLGERRL